jgi:hypothetical protein
MAANPWELYETRPSYVMAFHGCSRKTGEAALAEHPKHLPFAKNEHDWLGHGIYFWEGNPGRALEWAKTHHPKDPFVVGAVIDLGRCLDLLDVSGIAQVKDAYETLSKIYAAVGEELPRNKGPLPDKGRRLLDCLVINTIHEYRKSQDAPPCDTVRAMFPEGDPLYEGAGFLEKNHIQICVRSTRSIKAYFRPILVG